MLGIGSSVRPPDLSRIKGSASAMSSIISLISLLILQLLRVRVVTLFAMQVGMDPKGVVLPG